MKMNITTKLGIIAAGTFALYMGNVIHKNIEEGTAHFIGSEKITFPREKMERFREDLEHRVGLISFYKKGSRYISAVYLIRENGLHLLDCEINLQRDECIFLGKQYDEDGDGKLDWGLPGDTTPLDTREDIYPLVEEKLKRYIK